MRINTKEKRGRQDKKAVSEVLATILIVLFVIASLVIVSVVLFQFIRSKSQEITAGCVSIDIPITKAEYNQTGNITMVYVKMAGGDAEMTGMKFVFDGKEKMPSSESDNAALKILETGRYIFNNITSKPKKIEAAPIIKTEADKEMNCGIKAIIREKDIVEKSVSTSAPAPPSPQFQDIRTGLIAEWKFDESSGTTASDSSGNNNHGILLNGPVWTTGKKGNALSFDGVNDYVDIGGSLDPVLEGSPASFSISMWVNVFSGKTSGDRLAILIADHRDAANTGFFIGYSNTSNSFGDTFALGSSWSNTYTGGTGVNSVELNKFYYLTYTVEGATVKVYLDGNLKSNATGTRNNLGDITRSLSIGYDVNMGLGTSHFNGTIDEVRIYNKALIAAEINQLYQFYQ